MAAARTVVKGRPPSAAGDGVFASESTLRNASLAISSYYFERGGRGNVCPSQGRPARWLKIVHSLDISVTGAEDSTSNFTEVLCAGGPHGRAWVGERKAAKP